MTLEQQAISIITSLSADKLSQVVSFARFLLAEERHATVLPEKQDEAFIRKPGILKGQIKIADDFDDTPDCFKEYL